MYNKLKNKIETFGSYYPSDSISKNEESQSIMQSSMCNIQADDSDEYDDLLSFRSNSGFLPSSGHDQNYDSFKKLVNFESQAAEVRKRLESRHE